MLKVFACVVSLTALLAPSLPQGGLTAAEIDERVQKWQPTEKELRWRRIDWALDIRDALKRARETGRPVFLFTHDGRLGVGRC